MAADGIVEAVDVTADCACGFDPALDEGAPGSSTLRVLKNVSTMALSSMVSSTDIEIEMRSFSAQPGTRRSSIGCHGPRGE